MEIQEKQGYRTIPKTGVQIKRPNRGTGQEIKEKPGYRSKGKTGVQIKRQNRGTAQEIQEKQGYSKVFLEGKTRVQISFVGPEMEI